VTPRTAGYRLVAEDLNQEIELADAAELAGGDMPLLRAGLRMLPPGPCALVTRADAPPGSGLGSSGAMDVALVAALTAARGESPDIRATADLACRLEGVEAGSPAAGRTSSPPPTAASSASPSAIPTPRSSRSRSPPTSPMPSLGACCSATPAHPVSPGRRSGG
jgi:hypothetical protein